MTGSVLYRPSFHKCPTPDLSHGRDPAFYSQPGTVWECECGRTWVAKSWLPGHMYPHWRLEGWLERRRRERSTSSFVVYRRNGLMWVGERDGALVHAVAKFQLWRPSHLWLLVRQRGRIESRW